MKVAITARHFDPTPDLRGTRGIPRSSSREVRGESPPCARRAGSGKYRQIAEVSVHGSHGNFVAQAESVRHVRLHRRGVRQGREADHSAGEARIKTRDGDKEGAAMGTPGYPASA